MRKMVSIVLSLMVASAVGYGLYRSYIDKNGQSSSFFQTKTQTVSLLTSSTKISFLQDARVVSILEKNGLTVNATRMEQNKTGTLETDLSKIKEFDAVWPTGVKAANDVAQAYGGAERYTIYSTPLVIASWKALLPTLSKSQLVKPVANTNYAMLSLEPTIALMLSNKRWDQLPDNNVFSVKKSILIATPDPRKSNTASLYLALLAAVKNNYEMPQSVEMAQKITTELAPLITRQGFLEDSPIGPFEDYLGQGMGKAPLVLIQESQFLEAARQNKLNDNHVLLYPEPGLMTKHIMVAKSASGKRLGELLSTNEELQKIAAEYGFRINNPKLFQQVVKTPVPDLLNQLDAPSTTILNAMNQIMLQAIQQ